MQMSLGFSKAIKNAPFQCYSLLLLKNFKRSFQKENFFKIKMSFVIDHCPNNLNFCAFFNSSKVFSTQYLGPYQNKKSKQKIIHYTCRFPLWWFLGLSSLVNSTVRSRRIPTKPNILVRLLPNWIFFNS